MLLRLRLFGIALASTIVICDGIHRGKIRTGENYKMSKILGFFVAVLLASSFAMAQTTATKVVQNADGSYTVIEYPVGKEVMVDLTPGTMLTGAKGTAKVMRSADGTKVWVDVNNVTGDTSNFYAYAVDPMGATTYLGPVMVENGMGKAEFSTPLISSWLYLSSNEGLTAINADTPVYFRSAVPTGYAIVPRHMTSETKAVATSSEVSSTYNVPMLNVPSFGGKTTEVRIKFAGDLEGLDGKAYINAGKGTNQIKMRFGDMKKVPTNTRLVLWASAPDGTYTKLGQVINSGKRDESEIRSETALKDFGLFVTVEDVDVNTPTSSRYSVFSVNP